MLIAVTLRHPFIQEETMKSHTPKWISRGPAPATSEGCEAFRFPRAWLTGIAACAIIGATSVSATVLDIKTLSTRPDRVSGGDVLVQITQDNNVATPVAL